MQTERSEQPRQPSRRDRLPSPAKLRPGPPLELHQLRHEFGGEHCLAFADNREQVAQQQLAHVLAVLRPTSGQQQGRLPRPLRPFASHRVRNGEQRLPIVSLAIAQGVGDHRRSGAKTVQVIDRPAGKLALQGSERRG